MARSKRRWLALENRSSTDRRAAWPGTLRKDRLRASSSILICQVLVAPGLKKQSG